MLALIAGQGVLPVLLHEHLTTGGHAPLVAELEGYSSDIADITPIRFRIEQLGTLLKTLQARGVSEVCFAGSIARPALDPSAVDAATMAFVPRIVAALQSGDDGALRVVLSIFEEAGFQIRAAHEILPDLLPGSGVLTAQQPSNRDREDAARGQKILAAMGAADLGQSCVVVAGQSLAVEATGGTDWMLRSIDGERRPQAPSGGVLFKGAKPDQDRRIDLPVIGPDTVRLAAQAGLSGIVVEAGSVMVLQQARTVALADQHQLFLWVRERD